MRTEQILAETYRLQNLDADMALTENPIVMSFFISQ